jgi:hypothetical protein
MPDPRTINGRRIYGCASFKSRTSPERACITLQSITSLNDGIQQGRASPHVQLMCPQFRALIRKPEISLPQAVSNSNHQTPLPIARNNSPSLRHPHSSSSPSSDPPPYPQCSHSQPYAQHAPLSAKLPRQTLRQLPHAALPARTLRTPRSLSTRPTCP